MPLPQHLESHLGRRLNEERDIALRTESMECPPVSGLLIEHLKTRFAAATDIKPTHPQLNQLLMIQYGCEKVIDYLKRQYDHQSLVARKASER